MQRGDEPVSDEEVLAAFMAFANFGAGALSPAKTGMDGARFAKLCRETGLQGGKLNSIAVDIIFSKIKAKVRLCDTHIAITTSMDSWYLWISYMSHDGAAITNCSRAPICTSHQVQSDE